MGVVTGSHSSGRLHGSIEVETGCADFAKQEVGRGFVGPCLPPYALGTIRGSCGRRCRCRRSDACTGAGDLGGCSRHESWALRWC